MAAAGSLSHVYAQAPPSHHTRSTKSPIEGIEPSLDVVIAIQPYNLCSAGSSSAMRPLSASLSPLETGSSAYSNFIPCMHIMRDMVGSPSTTRLGVSARNSAVKAQNGLSARCKVVDRVCVKVRRRVPSNRQHGRSCSCQCCLVVDAAIAVTLPA